jgi:hypothetical protein
MHFKKMGVTFLQGQHRPLLIWVRNQKQIVTLAEQHTRYGVKK